MSDLYFSKINYTINEHIFIIEPTEYYSITYNTYSFDKKTYSEIISSAYRPVIFYKFTYKNNTDNTIIESTIPLYVSDGKTNRFRGNLLLPFLCIESGGSLSGERDGCPLHLVRPQQNDVYKLDPCEDLNTEKLFIEVMNNIKKKDGNYESTEKHKKLTDDAKKGMGLYTVLPRMKSFIIFLLNIVNYKIKYIIENNISDDKFNTLFQPYAHENNEISQYYVTTETLLKDYDSFLELYIIELVNLFKELYIDVIKNKNVSIEFIKKKYTDFINIDVSALNNKINVCSDNKINSNYYKNYQKFNTISLTLSEIYKITQQKLSNFINDNSICNTLTKTFNTFHLDCNSEIALFFKNFSALYQYINEGFLINKLLDKYQIFLSNYTDFLNESSYNPKNIHIILEEGIQDTIINDILEQYNTLFDTIALLYENYNNLERNRNDKKIHDLFREFNTYFNLIIFDELEFAKKEENVVPDTLNLNLTFSDKKLEDLGNFTTYTFSKTSYDNIIDYVTNNVHNINSVLIKLNEIVTDDTDIYKQKYLKYKSKYIKLKNILN